MLTRQGCNAGTCHGSPSGKGGFALSLFAFDAASDHNALTRDLLGRRVDLFNPSLSLILRKPSTALAHRGGLKLPQGSQEYRLLYDWIAQGAKFATHWSYTPPVRHAPPKPTRHTDWVRNETDHFILRRLLQEGLSPSPAADRTALIRRVSLDLTGLPPGLEEVDAYVNDNEPAAYQRLVDRCLLYTTAAADE